MNTAAEFGKKLTLFIFALVLFVIASEWWVTAHQYPDFGFNNSNVIIKLLVAVSLFYAILRGQFWARCLAGFLLVLSGTVGLLNNYGDLPWAQWAKISAIILFMAGIWLLLSKTISALQTHSN
jgi:hypothetical protein